MKILVPESHIWELSAHQKGPLRSVLFWIQNAGLWRADLKKEKHSKTLRLSECTVHA